MDPFSFEHNFCKYCPILIILSLLQTEIICPQTYNWICNFTYSLLLHYLENAITYTSSQKLLNKSVMRAVISLLLQSRKFWWYLLLTVFFNAAFYVLRDLGCHAASCLPEKSIVWMHWNGASSMSAVRSLTVIFDEAIDQWQGRLRACVRGKAKHFEYTLWIVNVNFVHICYIQCDLQLLHL